MSTGAGRVRLPWPAVLAAACAVVLALKIAAPVRGWSVLDARVSHFPVINYFIEHGFDPGFPPLLAMAPGMHVMFAGVARGLHLGTLAFDGWPAFLIQSVWDVLYVAAVLVLWRRATPDRDPDPVLLLPMLASSYPLYSWLWPTTDLGAYACYAGMLAILLSDRSFTVGRAVLYLALALVATVLRQNYAALAAAPLALALLRRHPRDWPGAWVAAWPTMLPLAGTACLVLAMLIRWGGLTPPELARHGSGGHLQYVTVLHAVAFTGLVALPFAVTLGRRLTGAERAVVPAVSILAGIAIPLIVPLDLDAGAGRWASFVWTVADRLGRFGPAAAGVMIAAGSFIWISAILAGRRRDPAPAECVLFGLFIVTFLVQQQAWQRYVEVPILLTLAIRTARLGPIDRADRIVLGIWFALYGALSLAKPFLPGGAA